LKRIANARQVWPPKSTSNGTARPPSTRSRLLHRGKVVSMSVCVVWYVWDACQEHRAAPSANVPRLRLLLDFATEAARRPRHGTRCGVTADNPPPHQIMSMARSVARSKGGGRRPGDIRAAECAVGMIPRQPHQNAAHRLHPGLQALRSNQSCKSGTEWATCKGFSA